MATAVALRHSNVGPLWGLSTFGQSIPSLFTLCILSMVYYFRWRKILILAVRNSKYRLTCGMRYQQYALLTTSNKLNRKLTWESVHGHTRNGSQNNQPIVIHCALHDRRNYIITDRIFLPFISNTRALKAYWNINQINAVKFNMDRLLLPDHETSS